MLQDQQIALAISRFNQRSERQEDVQRLIGTYVDVGVLPQLINNNHQVFYGRRGTGKTHVMQVLVAKIRQDTSNTTIYIDCRTLGSSEQFSDDKLPISKRCLALFRDILLEIYHGLIEHIIEIPSGRAEQALKEADVLISLTTEPLTNYAPLSMQTGLTSTASSTQAFGGEAQYDVPKFTFSASDSAENSSRSQTDYKIEASDKVIFPELQRSLRETLKLASTHLYVLIDEWSSIPAAVQPYLAEFLKRSIMPIPSVTIKIAALEYRCHFSIRKGDDLLGFELGADIATAQDLDDYFVYDRNPDRITDVYADILYRHLSNELPAGTYWKSTISHLDLS